MSRALATGQACLLDTCVVSELLRPEPDAGVLHWLAAQPAQTLHLSAVSLAELWQGIEALPTGKRKRGLAIALQVLLEQGLGQRVLSFDASAAIVLGQLVNERRRRGRPIGFADAQIAATARSAGLQLVTRNDQDFAACGVVVLNPWHRAAPR